ncbi:D-glycero-beta-D-manno-heptose 1-phosphate adenylyltransferase [filamentous cyanobacterium CCP1]|nr:D-glycero-beta-D-manno-heptose 1-phosphate adenylyltransferase [filamentous cyanobacterium CCP2]PSB67494.1 D-glycero-beta-D-manno-heptose 1-phosphate adenylyltransferase [filamentous cyanobacterium CCP1]
MSSDLLHLIDSWTSLTVLVIGDAILDSYLNGSTDRLCREAPAPVVAIQQQLDVPGGAANTATNLASLGGRVVFLSVIGTDTEGDRLRQALEQRGVSSSYLISSPQRKTLAKQRVLAGSQILVRLDQGSTEDVSADLEQQMIARLAEQFPQCDAVIISDYGYGILTPRIMHTLQGLQSQFPRTLVIDSRHLHTYQHLSATAVKPNYDEAIYLLDLPKQQHDRAEQIEPYGDQLLKLTGAAIVAVTLDTEGAIVFEQGSSPLRTYAHPAPHNQTSGAGDTFISALTLALASGASTTTASSLASTATAIVVKQPGTSACRAEELRQSIIDARSPDKLILDQSDLATYVQQYRAANRRIVFTNGCFDILHPGHVTYLSQAKVLGDVLIIGVNSDESVRQLKGEGRPVNPLSDRLTMLSALSCVDHVIPFSDRTPHNLIRIICPHTYVKGGDYTRDTLPEASLVEELGGTVRIVPYVDNRSTTRLIHQIRALQH